MKPFVVFYATREGHTRRIAGAFVAASVHTGKHESEMVAFIERHRGEVDALPTSFLSVSLTAAAAEDATHAPTARA
jgi:menaquinone-dependent protoporphyrinogen IX oxidase